MKSKIKFIIAIFAVFCVLISVTSYSFFKTAIPGKAVTTLKLPIFQVEESVLTEAVMTSKSESNQAEFIFNILNYRIENNNTILNEIDWEYYIQIIPTTANFPVRYRLFDMSENREINIDSNLKSESLALGTTQQNHHYKLVAEWDMENSSRNLEENLKVDIEIKGVQKR